MTKSLDLTREREDGFSLLEMLVVLSILALVVGLATPNLYGKRQPSAVTVARQIEPLFRKARTNAIARGTTEAVLIDLEAGSIRYGQNDFVAIPPGLNRSLLVGRELISSDGKATLVFQPDGGSSGVELRLKDGTGRSTITSVSWLSGIARIDMAD